MKHLRSKKLVWAALTLGISFLGFAVVAFLTRLDYGCDWTGFGRCVTPSRDNTEVRLQKTLWDWLNLLIVPLVLAGGGILYNRSEKQNEQKRNDENLQENALAAYLDRISDLLVNDSLRDGEAASAARDVALGWTTMILPRLSGKRKGVVLQFLYGANLLNKSNPVLSLGNTDFSGVTLHTWLEDIYLNGANMGKANLEGCYLWGADLSATDLQDANLENANLGEINLENSLLEGANLKTFSISGNLRGAHLKNADFTGTDLSDVDLSRADLQRAKVTPNQLRQAISLEGATMPDGSKYK